MKEQALKASESATREWAGYSLTLLCLKVIEYANISSQDLQPDSSSLILSDFESE